MKGALHIFVIYDHPSDVPDFYVLRLQTIKGTTIFASPFACYSNDLETLRAPLAAHGLVRLARFPDDDPVIMETWF